MTEPQPIIMNETSEVASDKLTTTITPTPAPTIVAVQPPTTPQVSITILLVSGRRRSIDFDPNVTIGELKETVWQTWPADWADEKPPSSAFLRILYLGRILTDDSSLSSLNLPSPPESTVVHVSVRSFAPSSSEEDLKKGRKKRQSRRNRTSEGNNTGATGTNAAGNGNAESSRGCCGCVIC